MSENRVVEEVIEDEIREDMSVSDKFGALMNQMQSNRKKRQRESEKKERVDEEIERVQKTDFATQTSLKVEKKKQ